MPLQSVVEEIAHFCRTGIGKDPRLQIYRKHVRKKIGNNLKHAFPLTHHLLTAAQWEEMVDRFLAEEECPSPFFWQLPQNFVHFAKKNGYAARLDIPYLEDLIDFEWLEIEMFMMPDQPDETRIATYSYPVFEKKPLPRTMEKGKYPLYAYRHPRTKEIHFIGITTFYCRVLELLKERQEEEALSLAAAEFRVDQIKALRKGGEFLNTIRSCSSRPESLQHRQESHTLAASFVELE